MEVTLDEGRLPFHPQEPNLLTLLTFQLFFEAFVKDRCGGLLLRSYEATLHSYVVSAPALSPFASWLQQWFLLHTANNLQASQPCSRAPANTYIACGCRQDQMPAPRGVFI